MNTIETTVTVPFSDGDGGFSERTLPAFRTATPGLLVHRDVGGGPQWAVTHARSGGCLGEFDDPEGAMRFADEIGQLGDWLLPGAEIRASVDEVALKALRRNCGGRSNMGPVITKEMDRR